MRLLLLLGCALLAAGARAENRDKHCDDHHGKPQGVVCAEVLSKADDACPRGHIMAKLYGCYYCVDKKTCLLAGALSPTPTPIETKTLIPTTQVMHKDAESGVAKAKANPSMQSPVTGGTLAVAADTQADSTGSWASHLSNWAFAAPVAALALVGVGLTVRRRSGSKRGREFERLQEEAADEINPFCASMLAQDSDDGELEFVDEEQKMNEDDDDDDEDCDDEGPDIIVAHSILDDIDEEDEDDASI
jgi:hypothetical protein